MKTSPQIPDVLETPVRLLVEKLEKAAGDNLKGIVLYGPALRGDRPGALAHVAVVLDDVGVGPLRQIRWPLLELTHTERVRSFLIKTSELPKLADAFPTKIARIQRRGIQVFGDPALFSEVVIKRTHMRLRVEQELRNDLLRLRHRLLESLGNPLDTVASLRRSAQVLHIELESLLWASGREVPSPARGEVYRSAAAAFSLNERSLDALGSLVGRKSAHIEELDRLIQESIELLEAAVSAADALEVADEPL